MRVSCSFFALLAVALLPASASAYLLDDGGFDLATTGTTDSNSAWTLTANMPDGNDLSARFQTGFANANNTGVGGTQSPGTGAGVWFRSFEGNQGGSGEPLADATLTQSLIAPYTGDYHLSFVAGREVNLTANQYFVSLASDGTGGTAMVDLLTASIPDGNIGGASSTNPGGTPFSISLFGVTAGDTLTVTAALLGGADSQIPGGQSGFVDSFSLVPEPSSALLAMLGLAGVVCRRR